MTANDQPGNSGKKRLMTLSALLAAQAAGGSEAAVPQNENMQTPAPSGMPPAKPAGAAQGTPHAPPKRPIFASQVKQMQDGAKEAAGRSLPPEIREMEARAVPEDLRKLRDRSVITQADDPAKTVAAAAPQAAASTPAGSPAGSRADTGRQNAAPSWFAGLKKLPLKFPFSLKNSIAIAQKDDPAALVFSPGTTGEPSMEGSLQDVDVTYMVKAPFQFVRIRFDQKEKALRYMVLEPALTTYEVTMLEIIERAFERLIATNLNAVSGDDREFYLRERFDSIINIFRLDIPDISKERMFFHLRKKYLGYARIDTLMQDKYIEDISCNGSNLPIYIVHRAYGSVQTSISISEVELNNFVMRLAQMGGRHISLLQPIRDVTLPDGSRANITLSGEVTKKGSTFTIRKFRSNPISPIELMEYGTIDAGQLAYLWLLMEYKFSILVSGGTATGKTTILNCLCSFIPTEYKIVSIEDTAEINLMHPNWVQSITRSGFGTSDSQSNSLSGISGVSSKTPGDISLYDLLVAALRQRPEFIIVGEVRGGEAFTLFQAIAVGHAALGTIHAGSMDELLARVESHPMNVPRSLLINVDAVLFPVHIKKGDRGLRRMQNIIEMLELERESNNIITNTAYRWDPESDEFRFQGRSYLFDKIKEKHGVPVKTLKLELAQRAHLLNWLKENRIRNYAEVVGWIRKYYTDREEVMAEIGNGHRDWSDAV